ncbi:MAG: hypothetical protein IPO78_04080 [Saprospiraceae bacterium]|nr:hypothetical protein [Saprospiraceae bacterium]MBK9720781.1 hypothetical protein [Saprospiraceae bacterium]
MKFAALLLVFFTHSVCAQEISYLRSLYADDFREWLFFDARENEIGTLRARWQLSTDYSQWDVRIGEYSGAILLRWNDRPNDWEIRIHNDFLTAAPTWPGHLDSWRITDHSKTYYFNLQRDPEGIQWVLEQEKEAVCFIYNEYLNDTRDWAIEYQNKEVNLNLIIAAFFLTSYYSTPK